MVYAGSYSKLQYVIRTRFKIIKIFLMHICHCDLANSMEHSPPQQATFTLIVNKFCASYLTIYTLAHQWKLLLAILILPLFLKNTFISVSHLQSHPHADSFLSFSKQKHHKNSCYCIFRSTTNHCTQ